MVAMELIPYASNRKESIVFVVELIPCLILKDGIESCACGISFMFFMLEVGIDSSVSRIDSTCLCRKLESIPIDTCDSGIDSGFLVLTLELHYNDGQIDFYLVKVIIDF